MVDLISVNKYYTKKMKKTTNKLLLWSVALLACIAVSPVEAQVWKKNKSLGFGPLVQNPRNEGTIYTAGLAGFAISRDYGTTWSSVNVSAKTNFTFEGAILGIAVMPNDTNSIVLIPGSFGPLSCLTRTTDGGETWIVDTTGPTTGVGYVNTAEGVFFDQDEPESFYVVESVMNRVLLRSSNKGQSYDTIVHFDSLGYGPVNWMCAGAVHPVTKDIYVGGFYGMLFRSKDKGKTWQRNFVTSLRPNDSAVYQLKVPAVKFCTKSPNIGFATISQRDTHDEVPGTRVGGLYKTTDYGVTWKLIAFGGHSMWALDVKEDEAGAIHVATGSYWNPSDSGLVAYSSDGGTTWIEYRDDALPWFYTRRSSIDIIITMKNSPFYNQKRLLVGTDEGFFYLGWGSTSSAPELVSPPTAPVRIFRSGNECTVRVTTDQNLDGARVHVYNVAGGEVLSYSPEVLPFSSTDFEFQLPAPVPGAYYLVIRSSAGSYTAPFIVN